MNLPAVIGIPLICRLESHDDRLLGRREIMLANSLDQALYAVGEVVADHQALEKVIRQLGHERKLDIHDFVGAKIDLQHNPRMFVQLVHRCALRSFGVTRDQDGMHVFHVVSFPMNASL